MKNWEFYEKELKEHTLSFAVKDNQVHWCSDVRCDECMFYMGESQQCDAARLKWLYQEYKEPVILTEDEKALCKLLGRGWITRNQYNYLLWYDNKPNKYDSTTSLRMQTEQSRCVNIGNIFPQCKFDFIKWEDEPWEVKVDD